MSELKLTQKDIDTLVNNNTIKFLKKRITLDLGWKLDVSKFKEATIKLQDLFDIKIEEVVYFLDNNMIHTQSIESIPLHATNILWDGYIPIEKNIRIPTRFSHLGSNMNTLCFIIFYDITKEKIPVFDEKNKFVEIDNPFYERFQPKIKKIKEILQQELGEFEVNLDPNELFKDSEISNEAKWQKKFWDAY